VSLTHSFIHSLVLTARHIAFFVVVVARVQQCRRLFDIALARRKSLFVVAALTNHPHHSIRFSGRRRRRRQPSPILMRVAAVLLLFVVGGELSVAMEKQGWYLQ
jgi:hypothetical protein